MISDKLSALFLWLDQMLLHVSRGVRWDSDHVVILSDELRAIAQELVRGDYLKRVHIGLDYFDASINRVAAWVIGTRAMLKALLMALLEPAEKLRQLRPARVAVYVDGCFWHSCPQHATQPASNRDWWEEKLARNRERDRAADATLAAAGWAVVRVWEHESPDEAANRVETVVRNRRQLNR